MKPEKDQEQEKDKEPAEVIKEEDAMKSYEEIELDHNNTEAKLTKEVDHEKVVRSEEICAQQGM